MKAKSMKRKKRQFVTEKWDKRSVLWHRRCYEMNKDLMKRIGVGTIRVAFGAENHHKRAVMRNPGEF